MKYILYCIIIIITPVKSNVGRHFYPKQVLSCKHNESYREFKFKDLNCNPVVCGQLPYQIKYS